MSASLPPRRLILLSGPADQAALAARKLISRSQLPEEQVAWPAPGENTLHLLGQDRALVVVDCYVGLNPDSFGRLSGMVQAGGALLLLCPLLKNWPDTPDPESLKLTPYPLHPEASGKHYIKRWIRLLRSLDGVEKYQPGDVAGIPAIQPVRSGNSLSVACTNDQQAAVDAVKKVALGKRRRPLVLSADRGRGKSAALGLAAGELLKSGQVQRILVTAGGIAQAGNIFKHAQAVLGETTQLESGKTLRHPNGEVRYVAADTLLDQSLECDLLIVDEAAALGVARLEKLLGLYSRLVFATTEHGYEGSGRGFSLKFSHLVREFSRGQNRLNLNIPVRWAKDDPLEYWTNQLLLLDLQTIRPASGSNISTDALKFDSVEQARLAGDETLLTGVFSLLIDAHYQTRPVDARFLLDAPNSVLFTATHNEQPVGLVWLMHEGGLDETIARELVAGRRRPQGHLVPQTLAAHLGLDAAATLCCARIQRIVVLPELQGQGIGSWMLSELEKHLPANIDYLASSYGADLPLSRFWQNAGYRAVRLSDRVRPASGLHSAVVLKPVSKTGRELLQVARQAYRSQYPAQLATSLNSLQAELAFQLAPHDQACLSLSSQASKAAVLFSWASRPYTSSVDALIQLALIALLNDELRFTDERARLLLIARVLQHRSWTDCSALFDLNGLGDCISLLRQATRDILEQCCPVGEITRLRNSYGSDGN